LIALYILIAIAAISALGVLVMRTVLHAALCLMVCLLSIAGIYIILSAEFLAVVQLLVYAGGILLLIIFGIMVTRRHQDMQRPNMVAGILLTAAMTAMLWSGLRGLQTAEVNSSANPVETIGRELITRFAGQFEISGLLILVSMIGAMMVASYQRRNT
jgi:NADH:ubiquinone oxidoreductase subunit 6 (subunit J)